MESKLEVKIVRNVKVTVQPSTFFKGFDSVEVVQRIFGKKKLEVLQYLKVEFSVRSGYIGVSDLDGYLIISAFYLKNGNLIDVYLDIIHEQVNVNSLWMKRIFLIGVM